MDTTNWPAIRFPVNDEPWRELDDTEALALSHNMVGRRYDLELSQHHDWLDEHGFDPDSPTANIDMLIAVNLDAALALANDDETGPVAERVTQLTGKTPLEHQLTRGRPDVAVVFRNTDGTIAHTAPDVALANPADNPTSKRTVYGYDPTSAEFNDPIPDPPVRHTAGTAAAAAQRETLIAAWHQQNPAAGLGTYDTSAERGSAGGQVVHPEVSGVYVDGTSVRSAHGDIMGGEDIDPRGLNPDGTLTESWRKFYASQAEEFIREYRPDLGWDQRYA